MLKQTLSIACAVALFAGLAASLADDKPQPAMPEFPKPVAEHAWLQQLVGEWTTEGEMFMVPGEPPVKTTGTESSRMIGGFWAMFEHEGEMPGAGRFTGILTLGYDPAKGHYVGTWIDSNTSMLWSYVGKMDEAKKALTLEAEGPCGEKGEIMKFRETIELRDKDHKVFTSRIEKDGKWEVMMTMKYTRKKT